MSCDDRILLRKLVLSAAAGTGDLSAPASGATITIWSSDSNTNSSRGGTRFKKLCLSIYTSHISGAAGLTFQESDDAGTNWHSIQTYTVPATTECKYTCDVSSPYVRVRYTNSASTLSTFRGSLVGIKED